MPRLLPTLYEYQPTEVDLTSQEAVAVACAPKLGISVTPRNGGRYELRPESMVGTCTIGGVQLVIRPRKLSMRRVLWMLSYPLDLIRPLDTEFRHQESDTIEEVVAFAFSRLVDHALARGVLQGYRTVDEALPTIRGRLRIEDQLRKRLLLFPPAEVTYDDYTEDIEENRLLRAALRALLGLPLRSPSLRGALRRQYGALNGAADVTYERKRVPHVPATRLNTRYSGALDLARLILQTVAYDLDAGGNRSTSFLVNMNTVFERFIHTALEEALNRRLAYQHTGELASHTTRAGVDYEHGLGCEYDTALVDASGHVEVLIDAKYKRHDGTAAVPADVHQMLAYCIAENIRDGVLVYVAAGFPELVHTIKHVGVRIHVMTVDLEDNRETTLRDVRAIADRIGSFDAKPITFLA